MTLWAVADFRRSTRPGCLYPFFSNSKHACLLEIPSVKNACLWCYTPSSHCRNCDTDNGQTKRDILYIFCTFQSKKFPRHKRRAKHPKMVNSFLWNSFFPPKKSPALEFLPCILPPLQHTEKLNLHSYCAFTLKF